MFFLSQYLQLVRGYSPLTAGLAQLPATVASIAVVIIVGMLVRRLGRGRAIGFALIFAGLGMSALALAESSATYLALGISLAVVGVGVGVSMTLSTDAVVAAAPRSRAGAASAISETAYELGTALGIAVPGSLQTVFCRANLDTQNIPAGDADAARESLARASEVLAADSPVLAHAREAFTGGMQVSSICAAVLLVIGGVIALRVIPNREDGTHAH